MRVAIMQPYFFPYLGYFDLLNSVDLFLVYDTVQYIRRGWIHRNRILHQREKGWQYIIVPTEPASQKTPIQDIRISNTVPWQARILDQMGHYKKTAPHAERIMDFTKDCFASEETFLSVLNVKLLERCAELLNINFQYQVCSSLNIDLDMGCSAEERILHLCEFLGAKEYVNLPGGVELYDPEAFKRRNMQLTFRSLPLFTYPTGSYSFEPNLSILDVLMWNMPEDIKKYLDHHKDQA